MLSIDSTSLGTALRFLRARQGLTQGVVAARARLTKAMLSSYEIGSKLPSFQSLASILQALNRDFHDLQEALDEVRQRAPAPEPEEAPKPRKRRRKAQAGAQA
jgi:transcriptional regulator with XRE-family HTH domain